MISAELLPALPFKRSRNVSRASVGTADAAKSYDLSERICSR